MYIMPSSIVKSILSLFQGHGWDASALEPLKNHKAGVPAGLLPCAIDAETKQGWVLLGLQKGGWSSFQGNADRTDGSVAHTACREGAEELCGALGDWQTLMSRYFVGC